MDPLLETGLLVTAWSLGFAAVGSLPSLVLLRLRPKWLGWGGLLLTVLPIVAWLALLFTDIERVLREDPVGSPVRQAPWGGMGGLWIAGPFFWSALMFVACGLVLIALLIANRRRAMNDA